MIVLSKTYFRHISYALLGSFYLFLPINLLGRFRTHYRTPINFAPFGDPLTVKYINLFSKKYQQKRIFWGVPPFLSLKSEASQK